VTHLDDVYRARFDERSQRGKMAVWNELVQYLSRWIRADRPVLDVACDAGYFIRHVDAAERWATDLRDVGPRLPAEVRFCQADGLHLLDVLPADYFGTIFMSNYLEHLPDSPSVIQQLQVVAKLLEPGGRVVVLQPNVRFVGGSYWDFIDHRVPLTERSLVEAGELAGLRTVHLVPRFLPYTTKGRLPQDPRLVRAYLRFPPAWRLLGKQTLYVAERPG
jgi:SAM-dependent methyltransferase